jgi:drug/metabolite transporter (DMT)-like permease
MPVSRRALGIAAGVVTAALWGSNHVVARAVRELVPLPALVFWRWLIGAALLGLVAGPALGRAWPAVRARAPAIVVSGVVGVGVFSYLLLGGAYLSPALEVGLINATTPIWVALLGGLSGAEPLGRRGWYGLWLAAAGTLLILARGDPAALLRLGFGLGNLLSLTGAITFAWFSLRMRALSRDVDALSLTLLTAWVGLALVLGPAYLWSVAAGGPWLAQPAASLPLAAAAILYVGVGPTMLGNLLYLYGVGTVGPVRTATLLYLSPVFSAALAVGVLGESLAWYHLAGVAVIAAGLRMVAPRDGPERGPG